MRGTVKGVTTSFNPVLIGVPPALEGAETTPFAFLLFGAGAFAQALEKTGPIPEIQHFPAFHNTVDTSSIYQP